MCHSIYVKVVLVYFGLQLFFSGPRNNWTAELEVSAGSRHVAEKSEAGWLVPQHTFRYFLHLRSFVWLQMHCDQWGTGRWCTPGWAVKLSKYYAKPYRSSPSVEGNSVSIAPLLRKLVYLAILFIHLLTCTASSTGQLKNKHGEQSALGFVLIFMILIICYVGHHFWWKNIIWYHCSSGWKLAICHT